MITVFELEEEFTKIAKSIWGDVPEAKFFPSMKLEFGDVYSDYCILLAKKFKKPTSEIFSQLSNEVNPNLEISLSLVGDYLNIKFNNFEIKNFEVANIENKIRKIIIFVPILKNYTKSLFIRLASKAFLQQQLVKRGGIDALLYLGNRAENVLHDNAVDFFENITKIYDKNVDNEDILSLVDEIKNKNKYDLFFIHLGSNTFYQKKLSKEIFNTQVGREKFIINFSSKDWSNILPEDDEELVSFVKETKDENILKALIYILSKNNDFHEINCFAPENEEQDNFLYFTNSTFERINKHFPNLLTNKIDNFKYHNGENLSVRNIVIRLYFLNSILYFSCTNGRMGDFIEYFDVLLRELNHVLNSPKTRYDIMKNQQSSEIDFIFNYTKVVFHKLIN